MARLRQFPLPFPVVLVSKKEKHYINTFSQGSEIKDAINIFAKLAKFKRAKSET